MDFRKIKNKIAELFVRYGVLLLYVIALLLVGISWWRFGQSPVSDWSVAVVAYRPYTPFFLGSPRLIHAVGVIGSVCILANIAVSIILWRQREKTKKTFQKEHYLLAGGACAVGVLIFIYFAGIIAIQ